MSTNWRPKPHYFTVYLQIMMKKNDNENNNNKKNKNDGEKKKTTKNLLILMITINIYIRKISGNCIFVIWSEPNPDLNFT